MEIASKLAELMRSSSHVVALTGAGMSTESGISDYRGPSGIWTKDPSAEARAYEAYQVFTEDPERYWREGYGTHPLYDDFMNAEPNAGHISLAQLEHRGYLRSVITQNIDNLHRTAGSSNVIEYHGNVTLLRCMECNTRDKRTAHGRILEEKGVPPCPSCDAPMKSDVVHFGEPIPHDVAKKSQEEMFKADMLLICGTSAVVHPFASLPELARYYRKDAVTMVEVNLSDTPLSHMVEYPVRASTSEVLSAIASRLI
jgi:NAD-dependent deacetylase